MMIDKGLKLKKYTFVVENVKVSFYDSSELDFKSCSIDCYEVDGVIAPINRKPKKVDALPQNIEDQMRFFINRIIDRVFADRKRGIYH